MKHRFVIPGDEPAQLQGSRHLDRLRPFGEVVVYSSRPADDAEKLLRAKGATCLINSRGAVKWSGDLLRALPDLQMITTCGIGTDAIDLAAAKERGIVVCNIPGRTAPLVAEHAIALALAVARRVASHTTSLRTGRWQNARSIFLRGKTLGVIGTGAIGAETARLGHALGMRVIAWSFHPSAERAKSLGIEYVTLEQLLRTSDVVSVHVRLSDETRGLLGAKELALLKTEAVLVNTARGAVVDTAALTAALQSGRLFGAGLDVFDPEPLPAEHPLLACDNVVLTPHNADQTLEGIDWLNEGCVENVLAFLEGRPQNRVA